MFRKFLGTLLILAGIWLSLMVISSVFDVNLLVSKLPVTNVGPAIIFIFGCFGYGSWCLKGE